MLPYASSVALSTHFELLLVTSLSDAVPGKDKPCEIVEGIRGYWREGKEAFLKKDFTSWKLCI